MKEANENLGKLIDDALKLEVWLKTKEKKKMKI
jgi:hypothetical protein